MQSQNISFEELLSVKQEDAAAKMMTVEEFE
jgi:hypothetical protein